MPPPKRPFTTSSLTSSLRSTFANQPLLSNLTNLDKLTEHATNLAHKAPFFDALNEQFQQARAQDSAARPPQQSSSSDSKKPATASALSHDANGSSNMIANGKAVQNNDAPNVDMSHLSEQERLMIQSVMAKAEISGNSFNPSLNNTQSMNIKQPPQMNPTMMQQHQQHNQPASMASQAFQQSQMPQGPMQSTAPYQQMPMQVANQQGDQQQQQRQNQLQQNFPHQQNSNPNQQIGLGSSINQASGQLSHLPLNNQLVSQNSFQSSSLDQMNLGRSGMVQQVPGQLGNQQGFFGNHSAQVQQQLITSQAANNNRTTLTNPTLIPQQNTPMSNQISNQYEQLMHHGDAQSYNKQQMFMASQGPGPVHQGSQFGTSSTQVPIQAQNYPASVMQPMNVISQPTMNNQLDPSLHQQLLFREISNLPTIDTRGNQIYQQVTPLQRQPAISNIYSVAQPESILRNRDGRDGIRFRSDTFRDDYAASDQETYDEHRPYRGGRRHDDRSLRRFNSMESGARRRQTSRDRLRDSKIAYENVGSMYSAGGGKQRQLPKLAELGKQTVHRESTNQSPIQTVKDSRKLRSTPPMMKQAARCRRELCGDGSLSLSSESELDDISIASSVISEKRLRLQKGLSDKRGSPRIEHCVKKTECDLNDDSIKRMSELKLTEQASQVMEQQQLLIQQSQELIKLQQAQLEQQSKNKDIRDVAQDLLIQPSKSADPSVASAGVENANALITEADLKAKDTKLGGISQTVPIAVAPLKSEWVQTHQSVGSKAPAQISKATSVDSIDLFNIENELENVNFRQPQLERQAVVFKKLKPVTNSARLDRETLSRCNRILLRSPSETSDYSDGELLTQYSSSRRRQRALRSAQSSRQGRSSGIIRREPVGLPPSPLPVSAAMQLHQLQQKHSHVESDTSRNRRDAYSRSRSVCNSPDQVIANAKFSRSIDGSRQLDSPDTSSEFGSRRKRLPQPPSNSMPLTPSIVRKMIQTQKIAATSSNKLPTSLNAQSTLLTNMHTYRNPCLDRAPNEVLRQALNFRPMSKYSQALYPRRFVGTSGAQVSFVDAMGTYRALSDREDSKYNLSQRDYGRFTPSNYGTSILKGSRYQDSTENREYDGRIRDLSGRYMTNRSRTIDSTALERATKFSESELITLSSLPPSRFGPTTTASTSSYISKPSYPGSARSFPLNYRRSSEGENSLVSRADRLPGYDRQSTAHRYDMSSSGLTDRSRDQWAQNALLSPARFHPSRTHTTYDNYAGYRQDLSSRDLASDNSRHLSRWSTSYINNTGPRFGQSGSSLDAIDSSLMGANRWIDRGAEGYANYQVDPHPPLGRHVLRDQRTGRLVWTGGTSRSMMRYSTR